MFILGMITGIVILLAIMVLGIIIVSKEDEDKQKGLVMKIHNINGKAYIEIVKIEGN